MHRRIYQAVRGKDPEAARLAMTEHLTQASRHQAKEQPEESAGRRAAERAPANGAARRSGTRARRGKPSH
jgi:hypothetical protein